jgi:uncharacterized protein YacL
VAELIADQLQVLVQTNAGHAVHASTTKVIAVAVGAPITQTIAALLLKLLALHLKTVIVHVLASTAVKTMIAAAVKKFVVGALLAAIVKAVGAKLGITAASAFIWVLLPLIAAFIAYEVATFPAHLGESVSAKVAAELGDSFDEVNENVALKIIGQFAGTGLRELAAMLARDPAVQRSVGELVAGLS